MRKMREKLGNIARQNAAFARALLAALLVVLLVSQTVPTEALATGMETIAEGVSTTLDQPEEGDGDEATGDEEPAPDEETGEPAPDDAISTEQAPGTSDSSSIPAEEPAEGEDIPESSATYAADDELVLVTVQGAASASEDAAAAALVDDAGLDDKTARDAAAALFAAPIADPLPAQGDKGSDLPSEGDGSFVNNISVRWMTADSTVPSDAADGVQAIADEESVLYQYPSSNASQSVRMRVSYALSGEHNYEAGDITITIPANIFTNRDGKAEGRMRLSMPENPDTSAEWNYQLVDGSYVITNTRPMSAATQGYMEFLIEDLRPSDLVDMAESAPFNATIEVVTHAGNLIGLKSNDITARFDTHAEIQSATKRQSGAVRRVPASEIPANQRIPDEEEYVIVSWYMNAYVPQSITTEYDLTLRDTVGTVLVEGKESNIKGFLIDETGVDETGASYKDEEVFNGYSYDTSKYTYVEVAYPFSAFEKETDYTFQNSVKYTLTEKDPDVAASDGTDVIDAQKVTTAPAESTVDWSFEDPVFVEPRGHFNVFKYGNSSTPSGDGMETISPTYYTSYSDLRDTSWPGYSPWNGYFGSYPSALNELRDGEDTTISYTINTVGFLLPWTYKEVESPEGGNPLGILENYGQRSVTMTTEDTGLRVGDTKLELGSDYVYQSVEFPKRPDIMKATAINLNEDGSVSFGSADDGTVDYEVDEDHTKTPDVTLQIKRDGGDWETWATANWSNGENGELSLTLASGAQIDPNNEAKVLLPEGTTAVRTQVSAKNAAVLYHIRVNATLLGDGTMGTMAKDSFEGTTNPSLNVWNGTTMTAVQDDTQSPIVVIDKEGYDTLRGYTTDTRVMAEKSARSDTDYENQIATVHYSAKVRNQTFITDETVFEEALANGEVQAERGGTWYDLLPRGMVPKLDTVKLRDGDAIREMYTLENYRGSGRTLLVVSADLTPVPTEYSVEELDYYEDVITIEFDATYSAESFLDYGNETHNVIAYRSDNEQIGTVEGYRGENNPNGSNNNGTAAAFADGEEGTEERELLGTLVEDEGRRNFLYAGADCTIDRLELGRTGLNKTVMVNNDGRWSSGLEYGDESEARDVYVSGLYSYRLGFGSGLDTKTSDIILYDSLENYKPTDDNNDGVDTGTPRWRGTFAGIDLTPLEEMGCAPKVYYSTNENLVLEEGGVDPKPSGDQVVPDKDMIDLSNENVWQRLTDEVDPSVVKAIAVDATKRADGTPFVLDSEQSCSVIVHMRAPQGNAASEYVRQDAHAFNNIYMAATTQDTKEGSQPAENFIRQDYTKVGLVAYELSVSKKWDDAENQDGKRPGSVTVDLYANGKPVEDAFPNWTDIRTSLTLSDANGWKDTFGNLPLYDDYGSKIVYSLVESNVEGYVPDIRFDGDASFTITNRHEPEKVDVTGTKTWVGDTEGVRPASVKVDLYADGEYVRSQTVRADVDGNWSYAFTGLDKYKPVGQEIKYTVKEDVTSAPSYIPSVDGTDITNTYHPYGNLVITKQTAGTTEAAADKDFSFTLQFTRAGEDGQTEEPILDSFDYVVYGANGTEVRAGTVATNGTISLKADQRAVISEIPEGVHYEVTEADVPGFTQSSDGSTGTIEPNEDQTAAFTNTYEAVGYVNLGARKTLTGRDLAARQFNFELVDQDGNVVRVASNTAADSEEVDADGNKVESAPVTFGALTYTQDDHGKTFTYTIREYVSDAPGYTYDQTTYTVTVKPTDNGDGTMSFDVQYAGADGKPVQSEEVGFENKYQATGSLTLNAYKTLTGGDLAESAFTFELGEVVQDADGSWKFNRLDGATNDANGTVTFNPISYDQTDVGSSHIYAIRETVGNDDTLIYDEHYGYVRATVTDNGNGTLSVATEFEGFEAPCLACGGDGTVEAAGDCAACDGDGMVDVTADSISFENRYVDGDLDIKKTVTGDTEGADPNQLFTFRVELTNEEGQPLEEVTEEDVTFEELTSGEAVPAAATSSEVVEQPQDAGQSEEESNPLQDFLFGLLGIETAHAAEIASGHEDTWSWTLDDTGHLTIEGTDIGWGADSNPPWYAQRQSIKTVSFVGAATASNIERCFRGCTNLTEVNWGELDTSSVTDMSYMFSGCSSLTSLAFPESFNTSKVDSMAVMFSGCSGLTSLDLEHLDTSSVTNMGNMFEDCSGLTSLAFPESFNTSKVDSMAGMFSGCSGLTSLAFPESFDTSNVDLMNGMFSGCSRLTSLDLEPLDTSRVTGMAGMFRDCSGLTSLAFPESFDTSKVMDMRSMFSGCSSLTALDLSHFNTSNLYYSSYMFSGCTKLGRITLGSDFKWPLEESFDELPDCGEQYGLPPIGWIRINEDTGFPAAMASELSSSQLSQQYPSCGVGTYVWNTFIDVHFNGNGGSGSTTAQKINGHVDSVLNPVGSSFSRSGYIFTGWNTEQGGSGLTFADGATIEADALKDYFADNEVTLYAQWESATDVTVTEGVLEITMPADYVAHIKDLPSGTSYRVYEQTPTGWVLVSSDNTTGTIQPDQTQTAAFVNAYKPAEAQVQIVASKMLDGAWADADSGFQFELVENGAVVDTAGVSDGGAVVFEPITYTAAGEHAYTIREKAGTDTAIDYDDTQFTVNVSVSKDAAGNLVATVKYPGDGSIPVFTNTTKPSSLSITKKAVGANDAELTDAVKTAEFTFLLTVNGSPYAGDYAVGVETRSTDDGTICLKASETATVDGLKRGDAYAVTEVKLPAGWTAGEAPGNATGTIAANQTVALKFTNTYAASGQAQLMAYKELPGASLSAGQYEFELYEGANPAGDAKPLEVVPNGIVDGAEFLPDKVTGEPTTTPNPTYGMAPAYFSPLKYTLADVGEHVYTIREVVPPNEDRVPGVTYDDSVWTATVTVTDNGDGTLSTAVTYAKKGNEADHAVFTNKLQDTKLKVEKQINDQGSLSGAAAENLTFEFTISLKDASGESLGQKITGTVYDAETNAPVEPETAVEVSDGESFSLKAGQYVLFKDVPYGTVYEVTETERPGWSQVADKTTGTSGVTSNKPAEAVFVNAYSATGEAELEAAKTFEGKPPEEGKFTFLLYDVTGLGEGAEPDLAQPLQRVGNGADGMVRFAPIEYTAADNGKTFTYEIRELQGTEENVSYDETVVTARVDVKDAGDGTMDVKVTYLVDGQEISEDWYTFQNWLKVTLARTGGPGVWAASVGTVVVALGCLAYLRRKRGWTLRHAKHARR